MKPITTDTYTFCDLIARGCLYVDKTAILHALATDPAAHLYFMARPRRFGKSLTITTLQALFQGRRELFKGLAIDRSDWDWKTYPVVRLDMASSQADDVAEFNAKVNANLARIEAELQVTPAPSQTISDRFHNLLVAAAAKSEHGKVVVLIDEYDKPLLGHLGKPKVESFRAALKAFYSVVKTCEHLQRFTFITGVSKFSKVSIFSDLNNLVDVTLSAKTATLCGYTHKEVRKYFSEHVAALGEANGLSAEDAFARVVQWYDGYRFEENAPTVINPVSLGRCLGDRKFKNYWYETGTPSFLVEELKRRPMELAGMEVDENALGTYEPSNPALVPLLFQTGYLTIAKMVQKHSKRVYVLDFPDEEVRNAFHTSLVDAYVNGDAIELGCAQDRCADALEAHDLDAFMEALETFFANVPYNLTDRGGEQIFQAILYTVLRFIGVCIETEVVTNRGRIDAVITTDAEVYMVEIKLNRPAADALAQIKEKGYAQKYLGGKRRVTLLGIGFSAETRAVSDWTSEVA